MYASMQNSLSMIASQSNAGIDGSERKVVVFRDI